MAAAAPIQPKTILPEFAVSAGNKQFKITWQGKKITVLSKELPQAADKESQKTSIIELCNSIKNYLSSAPFRQDYQNQDANAEQIKLLVTHVKTAIETTDLSADEEVSHAIEERLGDLNTVQKQNGEDREVRQKQGDEEDDMPPPAGPQLFRQNGQIK